METVVLEPGGGKTTELIAWMQNPIRDQIRVGVFHNADMSMRMLWHYREYCEQEGLPVELESWQFVCWDELLDRGAALWAAVPGRRNIVLGLDDLDSVLSRIIGWPVGLVTMTKGPR